MQVQEILFVVLLLLFAVCFIYLLIKNQALSRSRETLRQELSLAESKHHQSELEANRHKLSPHLFKNILNSIHSHTYQTYFDLAVKKTLLKDQLTLAVSLNDAFFTGVEYSDTDFANQHYRQYKTYDSRRLKLSVVYNFGKIKHSNAKPKATTKKNNFWADKKLQ